MTPAAAWTARRAAHEARVDALLGDHRARAAAGAKHPVLDFLFTYYSFRPSQLRRWHPGIGTVLTGPDAREYLDYSGYQAAPDGVTVDPRQLARRRGTVEFVAELLSETATRQPHLGCFGLLEWAMVYRADEVRHEAVPLRLGQAGTDAVVDSMSLRCTHFDAYRFFTPEAVPRNALLLDRAAQRRAEQPGCHHAGMDLYKRCYKLIPLTDSD
ncbi:MAG: 3-methyladenine DNA glycosylase, partial [Mycobacteriaceae bacterium]|nr:3-methyladenine DNA glycosylase [Mycobacteriaceae bacterium]